MNAGKEERKGKGKGDNGESVRAIEHDETGAREGTEETKRERAEMCLCTHKIMNEETAKKWKRRSRKTEAREKNRREGKRK